MIPNCKAELSRKGLTAPNEGFVEGVVVGMGAVKSGRSRIGLVEPLLWAGIILAAIAGLTSIGAILEGTGEAWGGPYIRGFTLEGVGGVSGMPRAGWVDWIWLLFPRPLGLGATSDG